MAFTWSDLSAQMPIGSTVSIDTAKAARINLDSAVCVELLSDHSFPIDVLGRTYLASLPRGTRFSIGFGDYVVEGRTSGFTAAILPPSACGKGGEDEGRSRP